MVGWGLPHRNAVWTQTAADKRQTNERLTRHIVSRPQKRQRRMDQNSDPDHHSHRLRHQRHPEDEVEPQQRAADRRPAKAPIQTAGRPKSRLGKARRRTRRPGNVPGSAPPGRQADRTPTRPRSDKAAHTRKAAAAKDPRGIPRNHRAKAAHRRAPTSRRAGPPGATPRPGSPTAADRKEDKAKSTPSKG